MKRRRFLQAATLGGVVALSGCSALPFGSNEIPTEEQMRYLTHYPPHEQVSGVSRVNIQYGQEEIYVRPMVYSDFNEFIFFTVNKNGNGDEVYQITEEEYVNNELSGFTLRPETVTGGTILLVVAVTPNGTRYTQTAVYYDDEAESLVYPLAETDDNNEANTTES